jgi:hypothetical protein
MQPAIVHLEPGIAPASLRRVERMEHRFGRRFRCGTSVRVAADGGSEAEGRLANVSLSGAYLQTTMELPPFAAIDICANRAGRAIELRACVVRRDPGGVGIEWCETPARSICQIFGCTRTCEVL